MVSTKSRTRRKWVSKVARMCRKARKPAGEWKRKMMSGIEGSFHIFPHPEYQINWTRNCEMMKNCRNADVAPIYVRRYKQRAKCVPFREFLIELLCSTAIAAHRRTECCLEIYNWTRCEREARHYTTNRNPFGTENFRNNENDTFSISLYYFVRFEHIWRVTLRMSTMLAAKWILSCRMLVASACIRGLIYERFSLKWAGRRLLVIVFREKWRFLWINWEQNSKRVHLHILHANSGWWEMLSLQRTQRVARII